MTVPLLPHLSSMRQRLEAAGQVLLGLDYDGTLTPIVEDPSQARLGPETREVLRALAARPNISVAILSGRTLDDLRTLVGLDGLIYAGNHGMDISGPGLRFVEAAAVAELDYLEPLAQTLACQLQPFPGAFVENKSLTISVHFRRVAPHQRDHLQGVVDNTLAEAKHHFCLTQGHKVWEIRPQVDWDKGQALRWIKDQLGYREALVFYLGDDETDEDAFDALPGEVTIKVGDPMDTCARFQVASPDDVREFLHWLLGEQTSG